MSYSAATLPLTGAGDATRQIAVDNIGGQDYQAIKLFDGAEGSTSPIVGKGTTPGAADVGLVVRPIASTAFLQGISGTVTVGNPTTAVTLTNPATGSTAVDANLTSVGSTKLVGQVTVANPTTSVSLSSAITVTVGNPTTAVEANLSSLGSTKLVGQVTVNNPTTAVSLSSQHTVTVGNPTTAVTVSSGVILGAGSTANALGSVALLAGTTGNTLGSVALVAGTSANVVGAVAQGPGSSANFWFSQSIPFSSANITRTTVNSSVDVSVVAANASRKALIIANLSTVQIVGLGLSTGAVTTALANINVYIPPNSYITFGMGYQLPLFTGPMRGINISSTAVAGGLGISEFA